MRLTKTRLGRCIDQAGICRGGERIRKSALGHKRKEIRQYKNHCYIALRPSSGKEKSGGEILILIHLGNFFIIGRGVTHGHRRQRAGKASQKTTSSATAVSTASATASGPAVSAASVSATYASTSASSALPYAASRGEDSANCSAASVSAFASSADCAATTTRSA
jgi:hypothetical protein